ncbi:hypothetical protein [Clostridium sp.]|uniref:hypothetical protein n=1 Tax=Clostridium sp. TaxID=1506 RepID=UPI0029086CEF|nr:hypothetical protein [Clostridium sp.]MDU4589925.1 hypothetical protein [Clostridium sp.]
MDEINISEVVKDVGKRILLSESLEDESDRGCALLATAYLENELEITLRARLINDKGACDDVFKRGALSNFASKINMAYLLGIISKKQKANILLIKGIRNIFGHSYDKIEFNSNQIKDKCSELRYDYDDYIDDATIRDKFLYNVDKEIDSFRSVSKKIQHIECREDEKEKQSSIIIESDEESFAEFMKEILIEMGKYSHKDTYKKMEESDELMKALYKYYCCNSDEV